MTWLILAGALTVTVGGFTGFVTGMRWLARRCTTMIRP
jgi:hypothetical protein